jgi:hypothetical protein
MFFYSNFFDFNLGAAGASPRGDAGGEDASSASLATAGDRERKSRSSGQKERSGSLDLSGMNMMCELNPGGTSKINVSKHVSHFYFILF